jgi:transcriptional regulator with XRE-family HTH domain
MSITTISVVVNTISTISVDLFSGGVHTMKKVNRTLEEQAILDNIIACLNYKNIEQKDLCEYLGFSSQMFTNWKNKSSNSYLKRLTKIAEFLDISVDHLLGKVGVSEASELEERLLRYFSFCDAEGKLRIIQCAMNEFDRTAKEKTDSSEEPAVG